jgi:phosphohistidine phosphatase SixA
MMKQFQLLAFATILGLIGPTAARAADTGQLVSDLKQGGYVIVFRHVETDESQKDIYPFKFDDMSAQRQLSDKGRETARQIGRQLVVFKVPIGQIYTSKLNRAVETGKLISGKDVTPVAELTDSGAGNASAMARPGGGGNADLGQALRKLANATPKDGTNTIIVTHKTNIADGFGKDWNDVKEGEASVFKPGGADGPVLVGRIQATELIRLKSD